MHTYKLSIKDKGRTVIPSALRREADLSDAVDLVATALPDGGFVVKTRAQILTSFWAGLPQDRSGDLVAELLEDRAAQAADRTRVLDSPELPSAEEWEAKSASLLQKLGLE